MTNRKQIALVTGSTRGIGKAIAVNFAQNKIDIVLTGRNENKLIEINNQLENYGVNSSYISADLSEDKGIDKIINYLISSNKDINILVNNAAIIHEKIDLILIPAPLYLLQLTLRLLVRSLGFVCGLALFLIWPNLLYLLHF